MNITEKEARAIEAARAKKKIGVLFVCLGNE